MKAIAYLSALLFFALPGFTYSQNNTLFDDSRVSSVYIDISVDSLAVIMTDVLSDHYFKAQFIFDDGQGNDTLQDVGFRLRGNTSRYAQKKSFKISFNEYVSGRKYQGVKKINLNAQHNDPSMIREKLFYDLWEKAGMKERRTNFVKLYINQVYYGLYTNLEEMEKEWLTNVYETIREIYINAVILLILIIWAATSKHIKILKTVPLPEEECMNCKPINRLMTIPTSWN